MFFIVALALYFGGYAYAVWRTITGLSLKNPYALYVIIAAAVISVTALLSFVATRKSFPLMSVLGPFGYVCMGALGITVTFFVINDIINLPNLFFKFKNFRFYSTAATLALAVLAVIWSLINVGCVLKVTKVNIKVPDLPSDSLRIVLLADLHITAYTNPQTLINIFDKAASLNPDIIIIAGDVVDTDLNKNDKFLNYGFERLEAPFGVYAVTGNHEYYAGVKPFLEMFKKLNIKVLQNENVYIDGLINISGINDINYADRESIKKALSTDAPRYPTLFISHRPESFDAASSLRRNIVQLSGHTHAGQIPPVEIVRRFFMKYNYGIYENNGSKMYITSGTRFWGPPMRLFNFSEIALITLEK
ncbi:MAG: metallophosphoesterase [Endomicrobium sp.]|nr:metallophosphoesterase [Endomicrobium sp.]